MEPELPDDSNHFTVFEAVLAVPYTQQDVQVNTAAHALLSTTHIKSEEGESETENVATHRVIYVVSQRPFSILV